MNVQLCITSDNSYYGSSRIVTTKQELITVTLSTPTYHKECAVCGHRLTSKEKEPLTSFQEQLQ